MSRIGVAIRVRPFLENEKILNMKNTKLFVSSEEKEVRINTEDQRSSKIFKFDKVFGEDTNQAKLYHDAQIDDLINKVAEGYHSTIFAYGQTGSGKTYTMEGISNNNVNHQSNFNAPAEDEKGLIPRAVKSLFETIKIHSKLYSRLYTVHCSYLQIYNEKIYDLLNPAQIGRMSLNDPGLKLKWTAKDQFTVENLFTFECKSAKEVLNLFYSGLKNKIMASHKLNISSSRSHSILSLKVESTDIKEPDNPRSSRLDLVDLAGSERAALTGNDTKISQKESIEINKSLFTLRQVISLLSENNKSIQKTKEKNHIPYRDSKLTCLLKQSIGGNSYCLMIACLAPSDRYFEENLSTLTYATKAAYISNKPIRNDDPKTKLINDLKIQVVNLTKELEKAVSQINFLSDISQDKLNLMIGNIRPSEVNKENINRTTISSPRRIETKIETIESLANNNSSLVYNEEMHARMIQSISMTKDLLKINQEVRNKMFELNECNENLTSELFQLTQENSNLREKLVIYEKLSQRVDTLENSDYITPKFENRYSKPGSESIEVNKFIPRPEKSSILTNIDFKKDKNYQGLRSARKETQELNTRTIRNHSYDEGPLTNTRGSMMKMDSISEYDNRNNSFSSSITTLVRETLPFVSTKSRAFEEKQSLQSEDDGITINSNLDRSMAEGFRTIKNSKPNSTLQKFIRRHVVHAKTETSN